ncbi:MAG: aminotransferase class I/II-fold pyridoxal phosphate-dependent enzyme [Bryobacterales bacterium]|nr:aminotransferase class I/II-fold pyridoxal phosphate-dependent enzyme [Bryobacterales bacterium]
MSNRSASHDSEFASSFTRRGFAAMIAAGLTEAAFAQRAAVPGEAPPDTVWLNGNEFPEGPPKASIEAMARCMAEANRYHYQEFPAFYSTLAASEGLKAEQILVGAGSSEILHAAVDAFTSPAIPFITPWPTYEAAPELAAFAGHRVIKTPLSSAHGFDVHRLAVEAAAAGGGLIYLCNPNNPTSTVTTQDEMAWLVANLPRNTYLLVDEAYLHYATAPEVASAMPYVREGRNVIVSRTFSKIYAMAGLRAGYAAAKPELIARMAPYRNNVISYISARAVLAALDLGPKLIEERRAKIGRTRSELCSWLDSQGIVYIPPQANFVMIETGQEAAEVQAKMLAKGVAIGRPFPALRTMIRVSIGTDAEMMKFRRVLSEVRTA